MPEKIKILIVDDSRTFRNILVKALARADDIEVIGMAWSGEKALELIQAARPDLITLDYEMPDMDGIETLKAIREINRRTPQIKPIGVIMLSVHTLKGSENTLKALNEGADDYILKPQCMSFDAVLESLYTQITEKARNYARRYRYWSSGQVAPSVHAPVRPRERHTPAFFPDQIRAIVIGISTGGPKALMTLLPELCEEMEVPILIVQHMPAMFTASLATSLDNQCRYSVFEAKNGEPLMARHVYIAPGGKHLLLRKKDRQIVTEINERPPVNACRPSVDVLFTSVAEILLGQVIALVLTGMGADGTKGIAALKEKGAYVIAQDEATSVVWGMPGSAVASGNVDEVLPLGEIPRRIKEVLAKQKIHTEELSEENFVFLRDFIQNLCGIHIPPEKKYLIKQRLDPLIKAEGCRDYTEFCLRLQKNPRTELSSQVIEAITTNETFFFRDAHVFEVLKGQLLPTLVNKGHDQRSATKERRCPTIRFWSVAAATGQEPYSLAMLLDEFITENPLLMVPRKDVAILATDISEEVLRKARRGRYHELEMARGLSASRRSNYFYPQDNQWIIKKEIQEMVEFRQLNLIEPFTHLGSFDFIFCRNVLMYFNNKIKPLLFDQFYQMLSSDGYLVLGGTENMLGVTDKFEPCRVAGTILYQKAKKPSSNY